MKYLIANWKMNLSIQEGMIFLESFQQKSPRFTKTKIMLAPSFTSLYPLNQRIQQEGLEISLAAQNIAEYRKGAYTGEVSVEMVKEVGCQYVILGHSERRNLYLESNLSILRKYHLAIENSLLPIVCFGESLSIYQEKQTLAFISSQLVDFVEKQPLILAYEPVWSIGTGLIPERNEIGDVLAYVKERFPSSALIYGGSVNPNNVQSLTSIPFLDGFLVGGASLQLNSFLELLPPLEQ